MNRYRDYNSYLKDIFGERVQKISLDAGLGCPNRDGTISRKGCIFCDQRGSGTGALIDHGFSIDEQIIRARTFIQKRYGANKFIAYFQSFTNTYAPLPRLKRLYDQALTQDDIVGLSVATRPDCVDRDILELLGSYQRDYLVWIEYGLQSASDATLALINRGHDVQCFKEAVRATANRGIKICAHVILGLPDETREDMLHTARTIAELAIDGLKLHLLYVVKGTRLEAFYRRGKYRCLEQHEYVDLVCDFPFRQIIVPEPERAQ